MTDNQKKALEELKYIHSRNPNNIALIICGSIARNDSRDDSDIDLYLVVKDDVFFNIKKKKRYFYGSCDENKFHRVNIDGKIVNMDYLREAVNNASDSTRESFNKAYTLFSNSSEVEELINKIYTYPESEQEKRIKSFYAFIIHYRYVGEEAFNLGNKFFYNHCVSQCIFFSGRLILTHNKKLFPSYKAFFKEIENCEKKPENFIKMSNKLLDNPTCEGLIKLYEYVIEYFKEYKYSDEERIGIILENEWVWYTKNMNVIDY